MQLNEKLTFIMSLTQTANYVLAEGIDVDPSFISRLRTGKRGIPRNKKILKDMGIFFAKRCTTDYQRHALAEVLGTNMALTMKNDQLAELVFYWLCGDDNGAGRFMRTFESLKKMETAKSGNVEHSYESHEGTFLYYGNAGKRAAARAFYQLLLSLETPESIWISYEEPDDWITEDYEFHSSLQERALHLIERGFNICQITQPLMSGEQMLDTLIRWLPLYMTGKVESFYYPRLRDNVHRRSIIVVPGKAAVVSNSLGESQSSYAVVYTNDSKLTRVYETEFQDYLAMCRPMLNIYCSAGEFMQCFIRFLTPKGARIQKLISLSAETAPPELLDYCIEKRNHNALKNIGNKYRQEMAKLDQDKETYNLIDIVYLASAEQVKNGLVPITASCSTSETLYYTPENYILHLENILRIMETCESYHFVPWSGKLEQDSTLLVKENHRALLVHMNDPFTVFEISQPEIVALYREYLLRFAEKTGYKGIHRTKIMSRIRDLICELKTT